MPENKTKPTPASVETYLLAKGSDTQRADCSKLMALLERVTGEPAKMWGAGIVGHGSYHYVYDSGRSGDAPLAGFAIRGREIVLYLDCEEKASAVLLAKLGKHKLGKSCLYFRQLADLDAKVLETLVVQSVAALRKRYG